MAKGTNNDLQNTIQNQSGIDIAIDDILIKWYRHSYWWYINKGYRHSYWWYINKGYRHSYWWYINKK